MSIALDLRTIARALDGEVSGRQVLAPGPGHSRKDRSISVMLSASAPDGFLAHSHAGDDWKTVRDYVRERSGIANDHRSRSATVRTSSLKEVSPKDGELK